MIRIYTLLFLLLIFHFVLSVSAEESKKSHPPLPYRQSRRRHPTVWGHWSRWGPCSRTCGQGVSMRTRSCLVWTGVKYIETHLTACSGSNIGFQICELQKCPSGIEDFRQFQCRKVNSMAMIGGSAIKWIPHHGGKPCHLNCKAVGKKFYYNFGTVRDGTKCYKSGPHVCVHGQCKAVGCDGQVGAGSQRDMCGVCSGNNATCSYIRNTFRTRFPSSNAEHRGYNEVIMIPRGSTHFKIDDHSRNNLALMDSKQNFVLNGHYRLNRPGMYTIGGTRISYDRVGDTHESLQGDGPTTEALHVMLLYREQNNGVNYEFWMPGKPPRRDNPTANQIISDHVTSKPRVTKRPKPEVSTLSETQIWDIVMTEIKKTGKTKQKSSSIVNSAKVKKTSYVDKNQNRVNRKKKRKGERRRKSKNGRKFMRRRQCGPCKKVKDRNVEFCKSDFVSKIRINGVDIVNNETRYDVGVITTYKNRVPLLHREFIWVPNICKCPRFRLRREYIVMGTMEHPSPREIRLSVGPSNYVRKFSNKYDLRMHKLRRKLKCK